MRVLSAAWRVSRVCGLVSKKTAANMLHSRFFRKQTKQKNPIRQLGCLKLSSAAVWSRSVQYLSTLAIFGTKYTEIPNLTGSVNLVTIQAMAKLPALVSILFWSP